MPELRIAQKLTAGENHDGLPANSSSDVAIQASATTVQSGIQPLLVVNPDFGIPNKPSPALIQETTNGLVVTWDGANADGSLDRVPDLDHIEVYISGDDGFTPSPDTGQASIPATAGNQKGGSVFVSANVSATQYVRLVAVARSGNEGPPSDQSSGVPGTINVDLSGVQGQIDQNTSDIAANKTKVSDLQVNVGQLQTTVTQYQDTVRHRWPSTKPIAFANSPSSGYISWPSLQLTYNNVTYFISAGNSNLKYIYWLYNNGAGGDFVRSNTQPTIGPDDLLVFINKAGVPIDIQMTEFIDGTLLVNGTVVADAVAANALNGYVITGATMQTAVSGARFAVYDVTHTPGYGANDQATAFFYTGANNPQATENRPCRILSDQVGSLGIITQPSTWQSTLSIASGQYIVPGSGSQFDNVANIQLSSISANGVHQPSLDLYCGNNIGLHGAVTIPSGNVTFGNADNGAVTFNEHVGFNYALFWSAAPVVGGTGLSISGTTIGKISSSSRYKQDIADMDPVPLSTLAKLRPRKFRFKTRPEEPQQPGLIAEEVVPVLPGIVHFEKDDQGNSQPESVMYDRIGVMLVPIVEAMQAKIDALEKRIAVLEAKGK